MKTNLMAAAALSVFPAFSAQADDKTVLDHLQDEAVLFAHQLNTVRDFCNDMRSDVLPSLNAAGLSQSLAAQFNDDDVTCVITYGTETVDTAAGDSLFNLTRTVDNARIATRIFDALSTEDRLMIADNFMAME